jgi:hypothetical protein
MPALLNTESVLMCPHGGTVQIVTSNTRVQIGGSFAVCSTDTFIIAGCPFFLGLVPHPCVEIQWIVPAERSEVVSNFTLTEESVGLCLAPDQAPQGSVLVVTTQPQVSGL